MLYSDTSTECRLLRPVRKGVYKAYISGSHLDSKKTSWYLFLLLA